MKLIRCDNHPDRESVATFRIIELNPGARPIIIGASLGSQYMIDLCEECADKIRKIKNKNNGDED